MPDVLDPWEPYLYGGGNGRYWLRVCETCDRPLRKGWKCILHPGDPTRRLRVTAEDLEPPSDDEDDPLPPAA